MCRALKVFEQDGVLLPQGGRGLQRHYLADLAALQRIAHEGAERISSAARALDGGDDAELARPVRSRRGEAGLRRTVPTH